MSSLTECNRCTLDAIRARAEWEGKGVTVQRAMSGEFGGWWEVRVDGERVALMLSITMECVC